MIRIGILIFALVAFGCKSNVEKSKPGNLLLRKEEAKIVNDYSNVLTDEEERIIAKRLYDYETATSNQIVVVTVDSINPYSDI